jgi:hypothetical protein
MNRFPGLLLILLLPGMSFDWARTLAAEAVREKPGAQSEEEKTIPPTESRRLRSLLEQGRLPDRPLTPVQVRQVLGAPPALARQVLFHRYLEQWHYPKMQLRLMFDCRRGQKARLQSVQRTDADWP